MLFYDMEDHAFESLTNNPEAFAEWQKHVTHKFVDGKHYFVHNLSRFPQDTWVDMASKTANGRLKANGQRELSDNTCLIALNGRPAKVRHITLFTNMSANLAYGVHNSDVRTAFRGVVERIFAVKVNDRLTLCPRPPPGRFSATLRHVKHYLRRFLPRTAPITHQEFVELYQGRRKKIYQDACDDYHRDGVQRKDSYLSTFVKAEKINFTAKPDPTPRVIQPRRPKYNLCVGRYLKPLEHVVYRAIDKMYKQMGRCKFKTVAKGLNAEVCGRLVAKKWGRFVRPRGLTFDASRFDQHVSVQALEFEHSVYLKCFNPKDRHELAKLLQWQLKNVGFVRCDDGTVKYTVGGNRMSGDMNTAVGNVLLMCVMMFGFLEQLGIDYEIINNGDDSLLIVEESSVKLVKDCIEEYFLPLGFEMKLESVSDTLESCQFCQTRPVLTRNGYRMCRSMDAFSKDCVSIKPLPTPRATQKWLGAIGACGMALAGDLPIFSEFYRAFLRLADGYELKGDMLFECGMFSLAKGMDVQPGEVTEESRHSFFMAFGILPCVQRELEELYKSVSEVPQLGRWAVLPTDPRYLAGRLHEFVW